MSHLKQHRPVSRQPFKAKGNVPLWKQVHVKVIIGKKTYLHKFRAPAGRGYTPADIEGIKEKIIDHLDEKFALIDFRFVQSTEPNVFSYIATGNRELGVALPAVES